MSKITITVSGPVGAGKTTLCAKLQIFLKHLGCDVTWKDGAQEANLGIEEWPHKFGTKIELVEHVVPTRKVYETYSGQNGWLEVSQSEYDRSENVYERRIRREPVESTSEPQRIEQHRQKFANELLSLVGATTSSIPDLPIMPVKAPDPVGFMMKHIMGPDRGFSWDKNDLQFSEDWLRVGLYTEEQFRKWLRRVDEDYQVRARNWRDSFDVMHRRAMRAEAKLKKVKLLMEEKD
jgi:hypothetical protein